MISSLKGERTPVAGDGTNDAPFPCLNNAELRSEMYRYLFYRHQPPKAASTTPEGGGRGVYSL